MSRPLACLLLAASLASISCGFPKTASVPAALSATESSAAAGKWEGTTTESLAAGHKLFVAKCDGCHGYPDLAVVGDERWPSIIARMGRKASLSPKESDAVLHFVLARRSASR